MNRATSKQQALLERIASERILILDGGMGTMIQAANLAEEAFRGADLEGHCVELRGNNDVLCVSRPELIRDIHDAYLAAGADIVTTNTFNATVLSQREYGLGHLVRDINLAASRLAREAASSWSSRTPGRPRFVAGSVSPTNRAASMSPDVERPGLRDVSFKELVGVYAEQVGALIEGGVDILLLETVFDTLNAKAALFAIREEMQVRDKALPIWISATIADRSGRTLSGQTPEAFWISVRHARPFAVGLNCSFGAEQIRPHLASLSSFASTLVSMHPNAGLPNELGRYEQSPKQMAAHVGEIARAGLVNIVGGCCGTTPEHIASLAETLENVAPRPVLRPSPRLMLSGLEPLTLSRDLQSSADGGEDEAKSSAEHHARDGAAHDPTDMAGSRLEAYGDGGRLLHVGERTSVAGSRRFAKLILDGSYEQALRVAARQVEEGAHILDMNVDDALLDGVSTMKELSLLFASDPVVARVPVMLDSSRWEVIEAGLECLQGKCVVNSISLKDGPDELRRRARRIQRFGAAAVVMCVDEKGQADTLPRRIEVFERACQILIAEEGFEPEDLMLDPNVFAVGTGLIEHDRYALDVLDCLRWIRRNLPRCLTLCGVSNLSFAFRGNETVREAMHSVFLYHAVRAGLDIAIVNAGRLPLFEDIDERLRDAVEDVVLARSPGATERLIGIAQFFSDRPNAKVVDGGWRALPADERLVHALVHGLDEHLEQDTLEALEERKDPLRVIDGPLTQGMDRVGELFGEGKMFLPQVIRSARIMKQVVGFLGPALGAGPCGKERTDADLEASESHEAFDSPAGPPRSAGAHRMTPSGAARARIMLATVKGDVHDIGKGIVKVVLGCHGHEVMDLGEMVPAETIVDAVRREQPDILGLSGLITPSLDEMLRVAEEMQRAGLDLPLLIGGATTSLAHTALMLDPAYDGPVFHVADASKAPYVVRRLMEEGGGGEFELETKESYARLREHREMEQAARELLPIEKARSRGNRIDWSGYEPFHPKKPGVTILDDVELATLRPYIDWSSFFRVFRLGGVYPDLLDLPETKEEARRLLEDAREMLDTLEQEKGLSARGAAGLFPAASRGDDVVVFDVQERGKARAVAHFLRRQHPRTGDEACPCLADLVAPETSEASDWIGAFVVSTGFGLKETALEYERDGDEYKSILLKALSGALAEAFSEWLHELVRRELWGYEPAPRRDPGTEQAEEHGSQHHGARKGRGEYGTATPHGRAYGGIRASPGHFACPDHTERGTIIELLGLRERLGFELSESFMVIPSPSVTGWYFSHPDSRYFGLGRIGRDQLMDYAGRKGWTTATAERWLSSSLAYDPKEKA